MLGAYLLLFATFMNIFSLADWCYQSQISFNYTCTGPDVWETISQQCTGRFQSPINIITRKTLTDERLTPFHFDGYQEKFHGYLINNGHTVQLGLPPGLKISEGNLPAIYEAVQLHLHWGRNGGPGSEHTIDGEQFPMEMHIVHIKDEYGSLSEAVRDRTGVAVLGFLFQESEATNEKFTPLIDALKHIIHPSRSTTLTNISLDMFIPPPSNMTRYYRYDGSLTTPDCDEAVVWSLFEDPIPLSRKQLTAFCQLWFSNGRQMEENYRPVQALNGRQVFYSDAYVSLLDSMLFTVSVLLSSTLALQHVFQHD